MPETRLQVLATLAQKYRHLGLPQRAHTLEQRRLALAAADLAARPIGGSADVRFPGGSSYVPCEGGCAFAPGGHLMKRLPLISHHPRLRRCFGVAAAWFVASTLAAAQGGEELEPRFAQAHQAYERNHWHEAYVEFGRLGELGHVESARIALQMWRFGPLLFGTSLSADEARLMRWVQAASCDAGTACNAQPPAGARASRTAHTER